jgi:uncharacterized protein (TIRG00374 family)
VNKKIKNFLTIAIPLLIGIAMVFYQYNSLSEEELKQIGHYFKKVNYFYIGLSLIIMLIAHYVRAYRWQYSLNYLGYQSSHTNNFLAVLASYFMNLTIPRSGEVSRAALLYKYEKIPFDKAFGTIVTERIVDFLVFLFFVAFGLFLNFEVITNALLKEINLYQIAAILIVLIVGFFVFIKLWRHSNLKIIFLIKDKLKGLVEGMQAVLKMKEKKAYIFQAFLIWLLYFLMFYLFFLSFEEAQNIVISTVLMGFIFGSLAIGLTNGGIGAYPLAVSIILSLFGVSKDIGVAVGWLAWTSQTIFTIFVGIISFVIFPILNKNK